MKKKFVDCFQQVLSIPGLTSYYLPVETLGCVEFSRIKDGEVIFRQKKKFNSEELTNLYQPLCFVMLELFERLKEDRSLLEKILVWIRISEDDFEDYARKLLKISKEAKWLHQYDPKTKTLVDMKGSWDYKL